MKKFQCVFGDIELITLDRFLDMLSVREVNPKIRRISYNTLLGCPLAQFPPDELIEDLASFERKEAFLFKGDTKSVLKTALFYQSNFSHIFNDKKEEVFENLVVAHMNELGETGYLVRVAPRTWMAAALKDFEIVKNQHGIGLACLAKGRTFITSVDRKSVEEVQKILNYIADEGLKNL